MAEPAGNAHSAQAETNHEFLADGGAVLGGNEIELDACGCSGPRQGRSLRRICTGCQGRQRKHRDQCDGELRVTRVHGMLRIRIRRDDNSMPSHCLFAQGPGDALNICGVRTIRSARTDSASIFAANLRISVDDMPDTLYSPAPPGAIAQLGERYNGIVEVGGSIPPGSTRVLPVSLSVPIV